jgi:hypothetical protein
MGLGNSIELVSLNNLQQLQKAINLHFPFQRKIDILQSAYASDVLYLITLYLSKCFVHFLYLHLTPNRAHNRTSWAVMGLSTVWVICSIFMIGVNCELNQPWADIAARCSNMVRALSLSRILSE